MATHTERAVFWIPIISVLVAIVYGIIEFIIIPKYYKTTQITPAEYATYALTLSVALIYTGTSIGSFLDLRKNRLTM
jgi:hypothetical protein